MAYRKTIFEYERAGERMNRLCKMNEFTDKLLRGFVRHFSETPS